MSRIIWSHCADPHSDVELLRPPEGEGLFVLDVFRYGEMIRTYLSEDSLRGLEAAIHEELARRDAGRSAE